ncbi:MAG: cobyrinate a,c-diamide synthase [Acidiferrobacteraceae bacterium]
MPRLLISAAHKSSGKTLLSIGLGAALRARGLEIRPFKKGPDYIDPLWLSLATGRPCHNLDFYLMERDELVSMFSRHVRGADVVLIEGNKGLYDGLDLDGSNSNAALATLLGTPVVLVLDARGMTRGVAPLILGYQQFQPDVRIAGVVLNQLGGARHEAKLRAVIEYYTDVPVLGAVHHDDRLAITERHLGLVPSNEASAATAKIAGIAEAIAEYVDLEHVLRIARSAPALAASLAPTPKTSLGTKIRIGIAQDSAFGFYYPGDLDALCAAGASLIPINTLNDNRLPPIDALFIGGGFPETHMTELEENTGLRRSIREAVEAGLPVYAECGGLMYLARSIMSGGRRADMVGAIPADIVMHDRPVGRGYVRLQETGLGLWPRGDAAMGPLEIKGHEFHYSSIENLPRDTRFAYNVLRGYGIDGHHDGIVYKNVLGSYSHLRDAAAQCWTARFVRFAEQIRTSQVASNH